MTTNPINEQFSQGKMILFLHPQQWHQKYVVPEIDSKAQRIMSGIKGFK
jgi:hypothetical protein